MTLSHYELYHKYAGALAYVAVRTSDGNESIGTAFHIGDGVFLTARHVLEGNEILDIATTEQYLIPDPNGRVSVHGRDGTFRDAAIGHAKVVSGPHYHPDSDVDVAAIVTSGVEPKVVPLGSHLDDWLHDPTFVLSDVVVLGYWMTYLSSRLDRSRTNSPITRLSFLNVSKDSRSVIALQSAT